MLIGDDDMRKANKTHVLFFSATLLLGLGIIGVNAYAGNPHDTGTLVQQKEEVDKAELLAKLEEEFEKEEEALYQNYTDEQAKKVKKLAWEIGKLREELYPVDPEEKLKSQLFAFKQMTLIHEKAYKGENVESVDFNDPEVIGILERIEKRKQLIERIENELSGNAKFGKGKSAQQLLEEFEKERMALRDATSDTGN